MRKVKLHISAGRGPLECTWVAAQVLRVIIKDCHQNGITYSLEEKVIGIKASTIQSVSITITSDSVDEIAAKWCGTIQWIGQSMYRPYHKRKNWYVTVFKINDDHSAQYDESEFVFQTMRSGGAGGQHVNKVSTAVRALHPPTGISTVVMDSRSQLQNKKVAIDRLKTKLNALQLGHLKTQSELTWLTQIEIERGNAIRTFNGTEFIETNKTQRNK